MREQTQEDRDLIEFNKKFMTPELFLKIQEDARKDDEETEAYRNK